MVDEMAEQIGEQNQPTRQTDLPHADAADGFAEVRAIELHVGTHRKKTEGIGHQSEDQISRHFIPEKLRF
jgi:hypothetical protein